MLGSADSSASSIGVTGAATPPSHAKGVANHIFVLLATNHLHGWTGSETLMITLIRGLRREGCTLAVYARYLDRAWAIEQCGDEIAFSDDLADFKTCCFDLAHVQHSSCLVDVRSAFPDLPIVFSSLGVLPFLEHPPPFDCGVARYLAVSEEVRASLLTQGIPSEKVTVMPNLVDETRFFPTTPIRPQPQRILVVSYKLDDARRTVLKSAAYRSNATLRFIGEAGNSIPQDRLAAAMNESDIVVSLGRGVVEAMFCGRVPLVFDIHGGDGLVTPENLDELRKFNFSGRRHSHNYSDVDLVAELGKYRPNYGERLREMALERFGLNYGLTLLLSIYAETRKAEEDASANQQQISEFCSSLSHEDLVLARHHQLRGDLLQYEVDRIKRTFSWRITKPFRLLANLPTLTKAWIKRWWS